MAGRHHQAAEATCQCVIVRTIIPCIVREYYDVYSIYPQGIRYLMLLHTEIIFYIPQFIFPSSKILTTRLLSGYVLRTSYSYLLNTYYQNPGTNNPTLAPSIPSRLPPYTAPPTPGSIIQRASSSCHSFIFLLTRDSSCLRSGYLPPFCLPHTAPRFDIRPVTTFGSEKERENECTQTSTVGVSLQGCSHFVLDSVPCVVYSSVWVSSDCSVLQKVSTL